MKITKLSRFLLQVVAVGLVAAAVVLLLFPDSMTGKLPVVNFAAGGVATPADAALMMQLGVDGVFVGSGIFKSGNPAKRAKAIVEAVTHYNNPKILAEISKNLGEPMVGINVNSIPQQEMLAERLPPIGPETVVSGFCVSVKDGERIPLTIADYDREQGTVTLVFQEVGKSTMEMGTMQAGEHLASVTGPLRIVSNGVPVRVLSNPAGG